MSARLLPDFRRVAVASSLHGPALLFAGVCLAVGAVRYGILVAPGAPATVDSGNWLSLGHRLLGDEVRSSDVVYPPAVPLLVSGVVALLGPVRGVGLVGALSSLAPAVGVFVVLRWAGLRWAAAGIAALLLPAASVGEAAAWGGFPQLIGLGLTPPFLWQLDSFRRTGSRGAALGSGLLLAGVLSTSHFVAVFAVSAGVLVIVLGASLGRRDSAGSPSRRLGGLLLVVLPSLPLAPLYLDLSSSLIRTAAQESGPVAAAVWDQAQFVFRDLYAAWMAVAALSVVTPALLADRRRSPLWTVTTSLLLAVAVTFAVVGTDRVVYLAIPAIVLSLGLWPVAFSDLPSHALRRLRRGAPVVLAAFLAAQGIFGLSLFPRQRDSYRVLSPGMVSALKWLRTETPSASIVATPAYRDVPFGWWVEGLGRRPSLTASPLRWLYFENERERARVANDIFRDDAPTPATLAAARAGGANYVLVPKGWDRYSPSGAERLRQEAPDLVAYESPAAIIVRVTPLGTPEGS